MAVPCVILAGGQGRRLGGGKPMRVLGDRPLWRHVADRMRPQVSGLAVNGAGVFGDLPSIADEVPDQGPLAGVLAAMVWAEAAQNGHGRVLTVAVDTPFLPVDLVARLAVHPGRIVMAATDDGPHGTCALWDVGLAPDLRAALASGTRKVTDWAARHDPALVRFASAKPPPFFNINSPEDLAQAEAWL